MITPRKTWIKQNSQIFVIIYPVNEIFGISERNVFKLLKNIACTKDHKFGLLNIDE